MTLKQQLEHAMTITSAVTKITFAVVAGLMVLLWFNHRDTLLPGGTQWTETVIASATPKHTTSSELNISTSSTLILTKSAVSTAVMDKCASIWRPEELVGRCFGLKDHNTYSNLNHIKEVKTSGHCRSLCCDMDSCMSWQYWKDINLCKLGDPARLGGEGGDSANWCEPHPPLKWNGQLKDAKASTTGSCVWVKDLPSQCFGLGIERSIGSGSESRRMTSQECQESCCSDPKCMMWQHDDSKGCFRDSGGDGKNFCEAYMGGFTGGRKCRPQEGCPPTILSGTKARED